MEDASNTRPEAGKQPFEQEWLRYVRELPETPAIAKWEPRISERALATRLVATIAFIESIDPCAGIAI